MKDTKVFTVLLFAFAVFFHRSEAQVEFKISLKPGKKTEAKIAATDKTFVVFTFDPSDATQKAIEKQSASPSEGSTVAWRPLRVQIASSGKSWLAEADDDAYAYRFNLPDGLKASGVVSIENTSGFSLAGSGEVEVLTEAEAEAFEREETVSFDSASLNTSSNGDMTFILQTLFKRHAEGYPGGKGDLDEKFEKNLEANGVSMASVRKVATNLERAEAGTRAKMKTRQLLETVKSNRPVRSEDMLRLGIAQPIVMERASAAAPAADQYKYTLQLLGIQSVNCSCDNRKCRRHHKCDAEEGWVNYVVIGPGILSVGTSERYHNLKKNKDCTLTKTLFSKKRVHDVPLIVMYQVVEDDDHGDTRDEVTRIFKTAYQTALDIRNENYAKLGDDAYDVYEAVYRAINRGEDDYYPIHLDVIDKEKLRHYMSGTKAGPSGAHLFDSGGLYRHQLAILIRKITKGNSWYFSLAFRLQGEKD